jgi:hypothetical protein
MLELCSELTNLVTQEELATSNHSEILKYFSELRTLLKVFFCYFQNFTFLLC